MSAPVAAVTGSSAGVGRAAVETCAQAGSDWNLALRGRNAAHRLRSTLYSGPARLSYAGVFNAFEIP